MKHSITYKKSQARDRRRKAIRKRLRGSSERPRLAVFRSAKHIYAQIINDENGKTLVSMSTISKELTLDPKLKKVGQSFQIGMELAKKAKLAGISRVSFDRGGFLFHGRVKALAEGARKAGLNF